MTSERLRELKAHCLTRGIEVDASARHSLTDGGEHPMAVQEYATTGGITLELPQDVWVNAPVDEWFCKPEAQLVHENGSYAVQFRGSEWPTRVLPLPGYLGEEDDEGRVISHAVFSHADRARLSPISGCSHACDFCDLAGMRYRKKPTDVLLSALDTARKDPNFDIAHVLVSGGTPSPPDREYFLNVCKTIATSTDLPVDVMMTPWEDPGFVHELDDAGVYGLALNIELFSEDAASEIATKKHRIGLDVYGKAIEHAVDVFGTGKVRSLIIAGLEPPEATLEGVEWLAQRGADPALSPFRPAPGTLLAKREPPSPETLLDIYRGALDIIDDYDVALGPRCIPCQHNTMTLPESGSYQRFSQVRNEDRAEG